MQPEMLELNTSPIALLLLHASTTFIFQIIAKQKIRNLKETNSSHF